MNSEVIEMKCLFTCFLMIMVSIFGFSTSVFAAESNEDDTSSISYEDLTAEQKGILNHLKLLDPSFDISDKYVVVAREYVNVSARPAQPFGALSSADMAIYITVSRVGDSGKDTFKVSAVAEWLTVPTVRVQDGFGIAWSSNFAVTSYNAVTCYKGVGVLSGKANLLKATPNTGFAYGVECSHYYGQALDWVRIDAQISQNNSSGIANLCATYDHATVSLGVSNVTFTKTPSITFTFNGSHDFATKITSFEY